MEAARSVDVLVVGGGPAGLAAALILSRTRRTVALFDSGVYRNANTLVMNNVPTHDGEDPAVYRATARQELHDRYGDTFQYIQRKIVKLRRIESTEGSPTRFEMEDDHQEKWIGRKVILGTGIKDRLPAIPGFDTIWGRSTIHCVFCHGTETKGKEITILLDPAAGPYTNGKTLSVFIQKFANLKNEPVTIIANGIYKEGEELKASEKYGISAEMLELFKRRGYRWELRPIVSISSEAPNPATPHTPPPATFHFSDGQSFTVPFVLHTPMTQTPESTLELLSDPSLSAIKEGLSKPNMMLKAPMGEISTTGFFPTTALPGVYAGGNATLFMGTVVMAANGGQTAGVGVDNEIGMEDEAAALKAL